MPIRSGLQSGMRASKMYGPDHPTSPSGTLSRPRPAVGVLLPLTISRAWAQSHLAALLHTHIVAMAIGPPSLHVFFREIQHRIDVVLAIHGPLVGAYKTNKKVHLSGACLRVPHALFQQLHL